MQKRPHIIIFNPDQWRSDVVGCHGNPAAVTPVIDRIAASDGVSFRNAFCQNPVCTPSRCSLMTGWYPHVRGHRTMHHMLHPERDEPNLLKVLKDHGYHLWWGGKNDLTPGQEPLDPYCHQRFNPTPDDLARWGYVLQEGSHGNASGWRGAYGDDTYFSFFKGKLDKGDKDIYCDRDWAMVLGAIDRIRSWEGEAPLCLYIPISYPHPPYCVEEPWYSITDRDRLPPRMLAPADYEGKAGILKGIAEWQNLQGWTEERWTELRATYYGMCARVDHQLGMLIDALTDRGMYDDSALFLFSDHGDYTGDYGIVEKTQNTFEDCLSKVPLVVKPPAWIPVSPRVSDALVELVDFSATVYDLTGIDPGYDHFGRSVLPLLAEEPDAFRDAVFCEGGRLIGEVQAMERESRSCGGDDGETFGLYYPRLRLQTSDDHGPCHTKAAMCRTRTHKYIRRHYEKDELYDLENDPGECRNVIDDPACAAVLAELRERMLTWYMETCDVVPRATDRR